MALEKTQDHLQIGVTKDDQTVTLNFGTPVACLRLNASQIIKLAEAITPKKQRRKKRNITFDMNK